MFQGVFRAGVSLSMGLVPTSRPAQVAWSTLPYKFVNATALKWLRFGVNFKMEFVAVINYVSGGALQRRYKT